MKRPGKSPPDVCSGAGFSLIEVLVALAVTSSLLILLMGALFAFARTAEGLGQTERARSGEIAQALALEPVAERILFSSGHTSWGREALSYRRLASRYSPADEIRLTLEQDGPGRVRLLARRGAADLAEIWAGVGEEAWFEYLTPAGWSDTYPPAAYYPDGLMPGSTPPVPAAPLGVRVAVRQGEGMVYVVMPVGGLPPHRRTMP